MFDLDIKLSVKGICVWMMCCMWLRVVWAVVRCFVMRLIRGPFVVRLVVRDIVA